MPAGAAAAPITIAAFTGPSSLIAGQTGTFQLDLVLSPTPDTSLVDITESITGGSFTFTSGEGETLVVGVPTGGLTASLMATFTFADPGTYTVAVGGTVSERLTRRSTEYYPVYANQTYYDSGCDCYRTITVLVGYESVVRIESEVLGYGLYDTLTVTVNAPPVNEPPPPPPIPEPGTMLLLGTGVAGLVARARRKTQ